MTTFHQELPEEPAKPAPTTSKGDEPSPVVEVPEFTGGVMVSKQLFMKFQNTMELREPQEMK